MQNWTPKFRQSSIFSKKPGYLSGKSKTLTSSNFDRVQYFWLKSCPHFQLYNVCKRIFRLFLFSLLKFWFINKNVLHEYVETRSLIFENNSRSKQNKKILCRYWKNFQNFNKKLSGSWSSWNFLIFQTRISSFLKTVELCLNILWDFALLLLLPNYKKSVVKMEFYINHANHLNYIGRFSDVFRG